VLLCASQMGFLFEQLAAGRNIVHQLSDLVRHRRNGLARNRRVANGRDAAVSQAVRSGWVGSFASSDTRHLQVTSQGRPIANEPDVSERIDESALTMHAPGCFMIPDLVQAAVGTFCHRARDQAVGIIAKHLNARRGYAELRWALPSIVRRLPDKKWRASHFQAGNGPEIPQLLGAESALIPSHGRRGIGDSYHDRDDRRMLHRIWRAA
ncbi:MAG: hypothetical protein ACREOG_09240, partial [Gemmatimonadaceae bacterium]